MSTSALPYDEIGRGHVRVVVTRSRPRGTTATDKPYREPLEGNPRAGNQAARQRERALLDKLRIKPADLYMATVSGEARVFFTDQADAGTLERAPNKYNEVENYDAVCGYEGSIKGCRLADCGLLLVQGTDHEGHEFDGFIHATRLNMNGDDQFRDGKDKPVGGVTWMLRQIVEHYRPQEISLHLVAGIAPEFYVHEFTATQKRKHNFRGWREQGWIMPHYENGCWDGKSYEANLYAAIRHQVKQAGLINHYDDKVSLNGDPASGHASHRAARLGKVKETVDLYLVIPKVYQA